jgi:hypothetical protein
MTKPAIGKISFAKGAPIVMTSGAGYRISLWKMLNGERECDLVSLRGAVFWRMALRAAD